MQPIRRNLLIYGLLLAAWTLVLGWQVTEHFRVLRVARAALIHRAKDISTTLGVVLRSQRRFGGVISKERLESALTDLVRPGELTGIALLNAAGDVVASAGTLAGLQPKGVTGPAEHWDQQSVTLMNLVDLGATVSHDLERTNPPVILSREDFFRPPDPNRGQTDRLPTPALELKLPEPPRDVTAVLTNADGASVATNAPGGRPRFRGGDGRPWFARPRGMSEEEYGAVVQRQGVHSSLIVMSTASVRAAADHDLWLRSIIAVLATVSVLGSGLAWRNLGRSAELQIRLLRASELNLHLRQMNVAAAGLAHETRNPLNIVRGLAQLISREPSASAEIRDRSRQITDEVDRVTAQLNEFINYSRPREVRRAPVALRTVLADVVRALQSDIEDKAVRLTLDAEELTVEADEPLLRQVLFNLLLNSIQAVDLQGQIAIVAGKANATEARLEVRDNGPGVPPEHRSEIFKPYFTTRPMGTGLGLAVVQQIALAHGWDIDYVPSDAPGALFRLSRLKVVAKSP